LWWIPSKKGLFKVKSFFCSLACSGGSRFPWKSVWRTQASSMVVFSRGQRLLARFLPWTISGSGM
jgi:hypothetical protein